MSLPLAHVGHYLWVLYLVPVLVLYLRPVKRKVPPSVVVAEAA